jgi:hypothetical protein
MNNKILKWVLIALNGIMFLLAIKWYIKNYEDEPLICIIGQSIILLSIFMENKFPNVRNIKNEDSEIETDISSDADAEVLNKKNKGSKIKTTIR